MSNLRITMAWGIYDRLPARFKPAGIDLSFIPIDDSRQIFDRMEGGLECDVSEMSISEHVTS